mgnify:FL=1
MSGSLVGGRRAALPPLLAWLLLPLGLVLAAMVAMGTGPVPLSLGDLAAHLAWNLGLPGRPLADSQWLVLVGIRLPRIVLALTVGASLGAAGAALQGVFRNPLADPGLIGVSSGAALAAAAAIVLGGHALAGAFALPLAAFMGGLAATLAVHLLARRDGVTGAGTMLLAGIAVNALAGAGIGLFSYLGDDLQLRQLTFWTMGSLGGSGWTQVLPAALLMAVAVAGLLRLARRLDVFVLGEREAFHAGLDPVAFLRLVVALTALAVGAAVSVSGLIGFVGLVVPHLVRMVAGAAHRVLLPASMALGALLLLVADSVARTIAAPAEVPIGLLCALIGAPFFLWLLRRGRHQP